MTARTAKFQRGAKQLEVKEPPSIDGRVPPHDLDAEAAVLSAIMLDPTALEKVISFLRPEHFYSESHKRIFEASVQLTAKGRPCDMVMVASWLKDRERIQQVGGMEYLARILNVAPAIVNVPHYARIIYEKWRVRQLIITCQRYTAEGYIDYGEASEFIAEMSSDIEAIAALKEGIEWRGSDSWLRVDDTADDEVSYVVEHLKIGRGRTAMLGGDSYTGKSVIACEIAICVAAGRNIFDLFHVNEPGPVRWLNYDQSPELAERRARRLCRAKGIDPAALKHPFEFGHFPDFHLDDDDAIQQLTSIVKGFKLCIFDALIGSVVRTQEKDEAIGRQLLKLMHVSHRTGCAFLVIHHTIKPQLEMPRKPKKGAPKPAPRDVSVMLRGNRAIFGACDSVFLLEATGDKKPVRVWHKKSPQDGITLDHFYLEFEDVRKPDPDPLDLPACDAYAALVAKKPKAVARWGLRVNHREREQVEQREVETKEKPAEVLAAEQKAKDEAFAAKCDAIVELLKKLPGGPSTNELHEKGPLKKKQTLLLVLKDLADRKVIKDEGERNPDGTRKKGKESVWRLV
jgi:hypothetical protein